MGLMITQYPLTHNACYRKAIERKAIGIQLHSIGCAQGSAKVIADSMMYSTNTGVTYVVDADLEGNVLQTLPEEYYTYADAGFGNRNLITIEMGESDYMQYQQNSANFTIIDSAKFKADITRAYNGAVLLCADICKRYGWNPMTKLSNGLYLISSHYEGNKNGTSSNHVDPYHTWSKLGFSMDQFRQDVLIAMGDKTPLDISKIYTSADFTKEMTETECAEKGLVIAHSEGKKNHLLPSILAAQGILESGYFRGDYCLHPELVTKGNNVFGMKCMLSGNSWNSKWDGISKMTIETPEEYTPGVTTIISADFRTYANMNESFEDHSLYLLGAMNGKKKRYEGIENAKNYIEAITIIKNGGYATDSNYISKICNIIQKYKLDRYDSEITGVVSEEYYYRVGTGWKDGKCVNQINAYLVLENAKKGCPAGYSVFDETGKILYTNKKTKVDSAVEWAVGIANDNSHGYDHTFGPDYDCSKLVISAWEQAGVPVKTSGATCTSDMYSPFIGCGFSDITALINLRTGEGLQKGDVLLGPPATHTEMMIDENTMVGALGNYDNKPGDSSGLEIVTHGYYNFGIQFVLRYKEEVKEEPVVASTVKYRVQTGVFEHKFNALNLADKISQKCGFGSFYEEINGQYYLFTGSFDVKENAEERRAKLLKRGFSSLLKEVH